MMPTRLRSAFVSQPVANSTTGKKRPIRKRASTAGPLSGSWSAMAKTAAASNASTDDAAALVAHREDALAAQDHQHGAISRRRSRSRRPRRSGRSAGSGDAEEHVRRSRAMPVTIQLKLGLLDAPDGDADGVVGAVAAEPERRRGPSGRGRLPTSGRRRSERPVAQQRERRARARARAAPAREHGAVHAASLVVVLDRVGERRPGELERGHHERDRGADPHADAEHAGARPRRDQASRISRFERLSAQSASRDGMNGSPKRSIGPQHRPVERARTAPCAGRRTTTTARRPCRCSCRRPARTPCRTASRRGRLTATTVTATLTSVIARKRVGRCSTR